MEQNELRHKLEGLTSKSYAANFADVHAAAADQILKIAELPGHSIQLIKTSTRETVDFNCSNCFMFALGVSINDVDSVKTRLRVHSRQDISINTEFVMHLIAGGLLRKTVSSLGDGNIVIYFDGDEPRHAGIWENGLVRSKWGYGATHVWRHPVFEVPASYGDTTQKFVQMDRENLLSIFKKWATDKK